MLVAAHEDSLAAHDTEVRLVESPQHSLQSEVEELPQGAQSIRWRLKLIHEAAELVKIPQHRLESGPDIAQGNGIFLPEELRCRFGQTEGSLDPVRVGARQ